VDQMGTREMSGSDQAERLAQTEREPRDAVAIGMLHEIRHPIGAIRNFVSGGIERLGRAPLDLSAVRALLEEIRHEADRADVLAWRFLDVFSEAGRAEGSATVGEVLDQVVALLPSMVAGQPVVIERHLAPDLPRMAIGSAWMRQAVLSVMTNSLEATAEGRDPARLVARSRTLGDGRIELKIEDCGSGSDAADPERMFERGFSTKPDHAGIGLWVSRTIVEAHGGELQALKGRGGGLELVFRLPARKRTEQT